MNIEIELKSEINTGNEKRIQAFLEGTCLFIGTKEKRDTMFCRPNIDKIEFRLREEISRSGEGQTEKDTIYTITRKSRAYSPNNVEINNEIEFEIESKTNFIEFSSQLGYDIFYTKTKIVHQYAYKNMLLEKVYIDGLGDFLEVEIISPDTEKEKRKNEAIIFDFFNTLEIVDDIKKEPYGRLLGKF